MVEQLSLKLMNMVNIKNTPNATGKHTVYTIDSFVLTHSFTLSFTHSLIFFHFYQLPLTF